MGGDDERERDGIILKKYTSLMSKSKRAVQVLEGIPLYATRGQSADPFVEQAFEMLNELWKLQYQERAALARVKNIKRWEIGEIASCLGQLHLYAYLRRSEHESLWTAYTYYNTVQVRAYFELPPHISQRHVTYIKRKIRFLARYCLVCMYLDKAEDFESNVASIRELVDILSGLSPLEGAEGYHLVVAEGEQVLKALKDSAHISIKRTSVPIGLGDLMLQEAVFCMNQEGCVKLSELPMKMVRFVQSLEVEKGSPKNVNKHTLYRPTTEDLVAHQAAVVASLQPNTSAFLYINANAGPNGIQLCSEEGLTPCDLAFASRKPFMLLLEGSGMEEWYKSDGLCSRGGVPFVAFIDETQELSNYVTNPVLAVSAALKLKNPERDILELQEKLLRVLEAVHEKLLDILYDSKIHPSLTAFLSSPFTGLYITRYLIAAHLHTPTPSIHPSLPDSFFTSPEFIDCMSLATSV
eukprot:TRINITY_DN7084_c0_g1_i4.p1 TRINITY_DN7084_c0_g1~~TRINITY_DN7084_c0_g1_i4.p1  ORF type:complete len:467 (+),score=98.83 TRINITY_DN7084_c0_g1_i4:634-2034(+)